MAKGKKFKDVEAKNLKGGEIYGFNGVPIGEVLSAVDEDQHVNVIEKWYEGNKRNDGTIQNIVTRTVPLDFTYQVFEK